MPPFNMDTQSVSSSTPSTFTSNFPSHQHSQRQRVKKKKKKKKEKSFRFKSLCFRVGVLGLLIRRSVR